MEYYIELANSLRLASRSMVYSEGVRRMFGEAADAIEGLVQRIDTSMLVLDRLEENLKKFNEHLKDAAEANEEIRNG